MKLKKGTLIRSALGTALAAVLFPVYNAAVISSGNSANTELVGFDMNWTTLILFAAFFLIALAAIRIGAEKLFRYRYVISGALFLGCVALGVSGSSVGMFDKYFGRNETENLFGISRWIRSDEWATLTPMTWSQYLDPKAPFSWFSSVVRAGNTDVFLEYGLPVRSLLMIFRPFQIGYLFLPMENGLAFFWCGRLIALWLVSFEFGRMITRDDRRLSLVYSVMTVLSPAVQWWFAINGFVEMLIFSQLSLICLDRYLPCGNKWKRFGFAAVIAWCAGGFVLTMYPAWMVPMAWFILLSAVWMIVSRARAGKIIRIRLFDAAAAVLLTGLLAAAGLYVYKQSFQTIRAIMNTAYPGNRFSRGGGTAELFFQYMTDIWLPFRYDTPFANSSELAHFISLAPMGYILYLRNRVKGARRDGFSIALCLISLFLLVYVVIGIPEWLAKVSLFSRTTQYRAYVIFEFLNLVLLIRGIALAPAGKGTQRSVWIVPAAVLASAGLSAAGTMIIQAKNPEWYSPLMLCAGYVLFAALYAGSMAVRPVLRKAWSVLIILVSLSSGLLVNPVRTGLEDIRSIPELKMVEQIVQEDPEGIWAVEGVGYPITNALLMKGARTLNSTNVYPDLDRWRMLDPDGAYEEYYNRYAHIVIHYAEDADTTPKFQLLGADYFDVRLTAGDFRKLGIDYVFTTSDLPEDKGFQKTGQTGAYAVYRIGQ